MVHIALLSNPKATGNRQLLPRIRNFVASKPEIFHYEVESVEQVARAMQTFARIRPAVIVINGGDGTVQTALTSLYQGGHFEGEVPPVAVLPNGKTNLIALDLGIRGDPIGALQRILDIARAGVKEHVVVRELIELTDGQADTRPVLGMFLGGAGLADSILFCRDKVYPLGLSNGLSHFLTAMAVFASVVFGVRGRYVPPRASPISISLIREGQLAGKFALVIVTTLEKLLLGAKPGESGGGHMKLVAVDHNAAAILRMAFSSLIGRLGKQKLAGVHFEHGDMIRIDGDRSSVILDGEIFTASAGHPIVLRSTAPVPFLRLAA